MSDSPDAGPAVTPNTLAPFHLRLFALIIDYVLAVTLLKLANLLSLGEHWDLKPIAPDQSVLTIYWALGMVLLILSKDLVAGKSPGKWLTNISVKSAGDPANTPRPIALILRNVTLAIAPVEGIVAFFDSHFRRWGDRLAATVVVVAPRKTPVLRRWYLVSILLMGLLLVSFFITPWNMRRSSAYQEAFRIASGHPSVTRLVGDEAQLGTTPEFSLTPDGSKATVTFEVEGPDWEAAVVVVLLLDREIRRWELKEVRVQGGPGPKRKPGISEAPPLSKENR